MTRLLTSKKYSQKQIEQIVTDLASGKYTHDHPVTYQELESLGFNVSANLPTEIYQLLELYPQSRTKKSSVQFIPKPEENFSQEASLKPNSPQ